MNRKSISTLVAIGVTASAMSLIPVTNAMALTIPDGLTHTTVSTSIGNVECYSYINLDERQTLLDDTTNVKSLGSISKDNSYSYSVISGDSGTQLIFTRTTNGKDGMSISIDGQKVFEIAREVKGYKGVSMVFEMPSEQGHIIKFIHDDNGASASDDYDTYYLAPSGSSDFSNEGASIAQEALLNTNVTNSTTVNDLKTVMQNSLSSDFTVATTETSRTAATESAPGSLKGTATITDAKGHSKTFNYNLVISATGQSLDTVYTTLNNFVNDYNASNNSVSSDFTNAVKITNSNISVTMTNFTVTKATETTKGNVKGVLTIKDSATNNSKTITVNKTIDYLSQSLQTIANLYAQKTAGYVATDSTTANDILNLVDISNSDISVRADNFKKYYNDETTGKLTMNVVITNNSTGESLTQPVSCSIQKCDEELATALQKVQAYLSTVTVTNDTTLTRLLSQINASISNSNISVINSETNPIIKTLATQDNSGSFSGYLSIIDSSDHVVNVSVNLTINKLSQTLENASGKITNYISSLEGSNDLEESDILFGVQSLIDTNSGIKVTIKDFNKRLATEDEKGLITGTVSITDGNNTKDIPINMEIDLQAQGIANVKNKISNKLAGYTLTNSSTARDLELYLQDCISGAEGNTIKIKVKDTDFKMTKATPYATGNVTGDITIVDSGANIDYFSYNIPINQLKDNAEKAKNELEIALPDFEVTNDTTADDLKNMVSSVVTDNINIEIDNFNKTTATTTSDGVIIANANLTDDEGASQNVDMNLIIKRLKQSASEAKRDLNIALPNFHVTNNTTKDDITDMIKGVVTDNIDVDVYEFNKNVATTTSDGVIIAAAQLSDDEGNTENTNLNLIIQKLSMTLDEAKKKLSIALPDFQVTNDTTADDLKNMIKNVVAENIDVNIKNFNKNVATIDNFGNITAIITLSDGTDTDTVNLNLTIGKLHKSIEEIQNIINNIAIPNIKVTNDTTTDDIINAIKPYLPENITVEIKDFDKTVATTTTDGTIKGNLVLTDNDNNQSGTTSLKLTIDKLTDTSIGGSGSSSSGGGSGSSSSKNNNDDSTKSNSNNGNSENLDLGSSTNQNTYFLSKNWKLENGKWKYYKDGQAITGWQKLADENNDWYYFDSNGYMLTGWIKNQGYWYYMNEKPGDNFGKMVIGWLKYNNNWYYLTESNNDKQPLGSMKNGWIKNNNSYYYLNSSGDMATGWIKDTDGKWYFLDKSSGQMATGWIKDETYTKFKNKTERSGWFYCYSNGQMATGWSKINGKYYYFQDYSDGSLGVMYSDTNINGYKVDKTGAMV
ncbi:hypothetical protein [uncultured Clostridium sp.]|uniref:hypothetical protein n=1 Tax=uncultured Clostridium sp. TaxID=59620 RepID=UPI0027DE22AC|nr:hypothetical protein [uncultured Clostridium sp.]